MRPEHLEDAVIDSAGTAVLRGSVVIAEPQGAEVVVHVAMPVKPVTIDDSLEVEIDDNATTGGGLASYKNQIQSVIVGRFDSGTSEKPGCTIDVAVNVTKLHFFDIESGAAFQGRPVYPVGFVQSQELYAEVHQNDPMARTFADRPSGKQTCAVIAGRSRLASTHRSVKSTEIHMKMSETAVHSHVEGGHVLRLRHETMDYLMIAVARQPSVL